MERNESDKEIALALSTAYNNYEGKKVFESRNRGSTYVLEGLSICCQSFNRITC